MSRHLPSAMPGNRAKDRAGMAPRSRDDGEVKTGFGQEGKPWSVRRAMLVATLTGILAWLAIFLGFSLVVW